MSSPPPDSSRHIPRRILRRAANLLTSNGQPTPAVQEEVFGPDLPPRREGSIGASIKRSLSRTVTRGIGLARSRSSSGSTKTSFPVTVRPSGHKRAYSEVVQRPTMLYSQSVPNPIIDDMQLHRSATLKADIVHEEQEQEHEQHEREREREAESTVPQPPQPAPPPPSDEVKVPALLLQGTPLLKVSAKKIQTRIFRLDPDQGQILWESKKSGVIAIESIKEIRAGVDARNYREQYKIASDMEQRWMTIIYITDGKYKTLHVVALATDVFRMWLATLRHLYALRQELMSGVGNLERRQRAWERLYWKSADDQGDERLEWGEVMRLCRRLNIHAPKADLKQRFKEADVHNRDWLDFKDFQRFVKLLKARPELKRLYNALRGKGSFDFAVFLRFMRKYQKSSLSEPELEKVFHRFALIPPQSPALPSHSLPDPTSPSPLVMPSALPPTSDAPLTASPTVLSPSPPSLSSPAPPPALASPQLSASPQPLASPTPPPTATLSLEGFTSFLLSAENAPFTDHHGRVWHDMTRPLSEYYISSSHNTYLVGHQLVGVSTIEGYIRALLHSCRSVELDIYDGDVEPMIFHGKTLTTKVPLREVCAAIAKYAFVASPYPIIISAEIHCSVSQQDQVAEILRTAFGAALVTAPLAGFAHSDEVLPSPEALRGRVLLKAKNLYVDETHAVTDKGLAYDTESSETTSTSASDSEALAGFKGETKELKAELEQGLSRARSVLSRVRGHTPTPRRNSTTDARPKIKMSAALAALLVYTVGVKCRGFNKKEHYAVAHVFSLSESTANRILRQGMMDLVKHNRTHVVRIYPKGTRLNSSNYEPHRYWAAGAQLVAINWQTFDMGYMINHAMFQRNGRAGYVLKPLALRTPDKAALARRTAHYLDITIISAQQLPRAKDKEGREIVDKHIVDPYVEVSVLVPDWTHAPSDMEDAAGCPTTAACVLSARTGAVKNNGFNPVWEEALALPFECVGGMTELVFVKFEVKEEDGEPLAVYCSSLGSLQEGFRHLPLHDQQLSQFLFSTLFVQIQVRTGRN